MIPINLQGPVINEKKITSKEHLSSMPLQPALLDFPFSKWGLEFFGPINPPSSTRHIFILTSIDYFTKWTKVVPLRHVQDEQVISFLESNIFFRFGLPLEIITDNGPAFISTKLTQFMAKIGVKHFTSSTYYPQGNGQVESTNKNLVRIIKRIIEEKPRDAGSSFHLISASKRTHQCTWRNRFQGKGGTIPLILCINLKIFKCN
jgi:hypothetical protein